MPEDCGDYLSVLLPVNDLYISWVGNTLVISTSNPPPPGDYNLIIQYGFYDSTVNKEKTPDMELKITIDNSDCASSTNLSFLNSFKFAST